MANWSDIWPRVSPATACLVALVALISFAYRIIAQDPADDSTPPERFRVIKIIDGDTVLLSGGDRLRLSNIDAPEKGEPLYNEAGQLLSDLVLGKVLRLEFNGARRDKYGRLLALCYVDTILVSEQLVRRGMAYLMLFRASELERPEIQRLLTAQRLALQDGVGMHGLDREAEEYYPAHPGSFRFHRPGCRYLENADSDQLRHLASREEALYEGLAPCRRCRP